MNNPRKIIWRNLVALMEHQWGEVHLLRLSKDARVAHSTVSRLKALATSPTADLLQKLARVFRLHAWQLLDPRLDVKTAEMYAVGLPDDGPTAAWPFKTITLDEYKRIPADACQLIEGFVRAHVPPDQGDPDA
jgi:transcriptional regulator with XRE-family HTH domain